MIDILLAYFGRYRCKYISVSDREEKISAIFVV